MDLERGGAGLSKIKKFLIFESSVFLINFAQAVSQLVLVDQTA